MKAKRQWGAVALAVVAGCCLVACERQELTPLPIEPLPEYLQGIEPGPGKSYTLSEYQELSQPSHASLPAICAGFWPLYTLEPGDNFPEPEGWLAQRVHLVIDGESITRYHSLLTTDAPVNEIVDSSGRVIIVGPWGAPFQACYAVDLEPGQHTAELVIQMTSGEELSYSWWFIITE